MKLLFGCGTNRNYADGGMMNEEEMNEQTTYFVIDEAGERVAYFDKMQSAQNWILNRPNDTEYEIEVDVKKRRMYAKGGKVKSNKEILDIILHNYIVYLRDIERICVEIREKLEDVEDDDFPIDSNDIEFLDEFLTELINKEDDFAEIRDKIVDNDDDDYLSEFK